MRGSVPGTYYHLGGTTKQGRNQPLWGMLIPDGPVLCTHHAEEPCSMAYPSLSTIPHCRKISLLPHKISQCGAGSYHPPVPAALPADRISHFCIWFVQLDRAQSLSKNTSCAYRGGVGGLLFPVLSLDSEEPSECSINPSVCTSFPSFFMELVLPGKLRNERTGAVPV